MRIANVFESMATMAVAATIGAKAQRLPSGWTADAKAGCRVWDNYPRPDDRADWRGPCRGGFAQGRGILKWASAGEVYETDRVDMIRGKIAGNGVIDDWKGHFVGRFADDRPNGFGVVSAKNGQRHAGVWRDGCFDHAGRRMTYFNTKAGCGF